MMRSSGPLGRPNRVIARLAPRRLTRRHHMAAEYYGVMPNTRQASYPRMD